MNYESGKKTKKTWQKPELKVLVKGSSEEAVLGSCKNHGSIFDVGPRSANCGDFWDFVCSNVTAS